MGQLKQRVTAQATPRITQMAHDSNSELSEFLATGRKRAPSPTVT